VLSGILFGILSVKPHLGLLLPLMLVLTGRWRVIASAVITVGVLGAATAWFYGLEIWPAFLAKVVPQQYYLQNHADGLMLVQVPSAFMAGRLVGLPLDMAWILQATASGLAVATIIWTFWRRRDPVLSTALLVTAGFLVTPYVMNYDMVLLGWALGLLRQRGDNEPVDHVLMLAVWTLPLTMMLAGAIRVPLAIVILPVFAARLLWKLAGETAARETAGTEPVASAAGKLRRVSEVAA
jgi:hypothetical protein